MPVNIETEDAQGRPLTLGPKTKSTFEQTLEEFKARLEAQETALVELMQENQTLRRRVVEQDEEAVLLAPPTSGNADTDAALRGKTRGMVAGETRADSQTYLTYNGVLVNAPIKVWPVGMLVRLNPEGETAQTLLAREIPLPEPGVIMGYHYVCKRTDRDWVVKYRVLFPGLYTAKDKRGDGFVATDLLPA